MNEYVSFYIMVSFYGMFVLCNLTRKFYSIFFLYDIHLF